MKGRDFPKVHFYDQDFVDIYDKTWAWIQEQWLAPKKESPFSNEYFVYPQEDSLVIDQFETIFSSFFLVYSNRNFSVGQGLDLFYEKQEENGAIRWKYDLNTGKPVFTPGNPEGLGLPLFAWAEYNFYHKSADKKRVKEVVPILVRYMEWVDSLAKRENGLYQAPLEATTMIGSGRDESGYLVDFNAAVAVNAQYMSALGDILNDKELSASFGSLYYSLKTRINDYMWDPGTCFYHDLDKDGNRTPEKTIAGFWTLLAKIPTADKGDALISHLSNKETFGTEHPFPTLSRDSPSFDPLGGGYRGGIFAPFNFVIIKGLEKYERWDLARECAIRHLYSILDSMTADGEHGKGVLWESYQPLKAAPAVWEGREGFPRQNYLAYAGLSTIALMIENVIGISVSLPRKTVDWIIPNLELMGIENLSLKRNMITILSTKNQRGWGIHVESEKLYYFTINILGVKKKTLPIPSGNCSLLIDKL